MAPDGRRAIYVLSDSTGETGAKVVQAALLQFRHERVSLRIFSNLRDADAIRQTLQQAAAENALVVYTLVRSDQRTVLHDHAAEHRVQAVDLMGPLMARVGAWLGEAPISTPGLLHRMDEEYFRRIEAMEFAVKNDDGQLPRNLKNADIVVIGVSRTSKTPVSFTLAQRGYRVANVPLVLDVPPPPELDALDPRRVYGLAIEPQRLLEIRRARLRHLGVTEGSGYAALDQIRRELRWAKDIYRHHPDWNIIDVTHRAVEETASEVLGQYTARFGPPTI